MWAPSLNKVDVIKLLLLEDKFLEGLKREIRKALIYYPTEPRNLEELFERAQKIDREIWGQPGRH
jgi:hypothetical protein